MIDFVDLPDAKQRRRLERALKHATARDDGLVRVLPTSAFGLIELARRGYDTTADAPIAGSDAAIFISYRREDSVHQVGRIQEWLARHFGANNVFYDVEIPAGTDWRAYIEESVRRCSVVLVPIGDHWLAQLDARRGDGGDILRFEIESALERRVRVIPLLVGKAGMPAPERLPESMRRLLDYHAMTIRPGRDFEPDITRLIRSLAEMGISRQEASGG